LWNDLLNPPSVQEDARYIEYNEAQRITLTKIVGYMKPDKPRNEYTFNKDLFKIQ